MGGRFIISLGEEVYPGVPWTSELIETLIGKPITLPGGSKVGTIVRAYPVQGGGAACEAELNGKAMPVFLDGTISAIRNITLGRDA